MSQIRFNIELFLDQLFKKKNLRCIVFYLMIFQLVLQKKKVLD